MKVEIFIECDFGDDPSITPAALQHLADDLAGQCYDWNNQDGKFIAGVEMSPKGCVAEQCV